MSNPKRITNHVDSKCGQENPGSRVKHGMTKRAWNDEGCGKNDYDDTEDSHNIELHSFSVRRHKHLLRKGGWDPDNEGTRGTSTAFIFNITCEFNSVFGVNAHKSDLYGDFCNDWLQWKMFDNGVVKDKDSSDGEGLEKLKEDHPEWFDDDPSNDYDNVPTGEDGSVVGPD